MATRQPAYLPRWRTVQTGMWAWVLQRLTGVVLLVGVGMHFYSRAVRVYVPHWMLISDSLMIIGVVFHALNGVRTMIIDFGPGARMERWLFWAVLGLGTVGSIAGLYFYLRWRL